MKYSALGIAAVAFVSILCVGLAGAEDQKALHQRMQQAKRSTTIKDLDINPWHLKFNIEIHDAKGNLTNKGTVEEWWADIAHSRTQIETTAYRSTIIRNEKGYFQTKKSSVIPDEIFDLESMIVHPMNFSISYSDTFSFRNQKTETASLNCIERKERPTQLLQKMPDRLTYCFDPEKNILREIQGREPISTTLTNIDVFQERAVARTITMQGKRIRSTAEVTELSEMPLPDNLFLLTPDMGRAYGMAEKEIKPDGIVAPRPKVIDEPILEIH